MKPLTKAVRCAQVEGRDWRKVLCRFLLNYRATPHRTTGVAPAELLFNRRITTNLLEVVCTQESLYSDSSVRVKDFQTKQKMKEHADKRAHAQVSEIAIGDTVLVCQKKRNKFTTKFDPSPYKVVEVKGTMVTAFRKEKYITRNISQFKQIEPLMQVQEDNDSEDPGHPR